MDVGRVRAGGGARRDADRPGEENGRRAVRVRRLPGHSDRHPDDEHRSVKAAGPRARRRRLSGRRGLFSYKTDARISQDWARKVVDREHLFRLANSWYPGERYIDKYGIKVGNIYPCTLRIITRGTCTPAIFKFPGDKDRDYFESRQEE